MPWRVQAGSPKCPAAKPYAVVKIGTEEVVGCHPTKERAQSQVAALYANEPKVKS